MSASITAGTSSASLPDGYWTQQRVRALVDATLVIEMAPIPADLSAAEHATVQHLMAAGHILDDVFQDQLHHQALSSRRDLRAFHEANGRSETTLALLELQELWQGPIATNPENERLPFLPVDDEVAGKNVYPRGTSRAAIEAFLSDHPEERRSIFHPYTVVRTATKAALLRDLAVLSRHPALALLHPHLAARWQKMLADPSRPVLYTVPYPIAWADQLIAAAAELDAAADAIVAEDRDLSEFLRLRARDLLANDYEGGDAAWIRGQFGRLDVVVGPYETYDDGLFGVKGFFGLRVLVRDEAHSRSLRAGLAYLQSIENELPIERHEVVRAEIPLGVYDAVADFGQQRFGAGDSQILPNDPDVLRKYGRKIILSRNLISAPSEFARLQRRWQAATTRAHARDLTADGVFEGTVWHEVGHYLGPTKQPDGRGLTTVLEDMADVVEELKADLISAFATARLRDAGHFGFQRAKAIQAGLMAECLKATKPNRSQAHLYGRLVMTNRFLDHGVFVPQRGRLDIRYELLDGAIEALLREVLELQYRGTRDMAFEFLESHSTWDERHESSAATVGAVEGQRLRRFRNWPMGGPG